MLNIFYLLHVQCSVCSLVHKICRKMVWFW